MLKHTWKHLYFGHMKILITLLSLGAEVDVRDVGGRTPLHYCISKGFNDLTLEMAERLIRAGANVNAQDRYGTSTLIKSAITGCSISVKLLLDHGAS